MNTFVPQHYVPILRWKEAERGALSQLGDAISTKITPLIEIVPENFTKTDKKSNRPIFLTIDKAMYEVAGQLLRSWGEQPFFIDSMNAPPFAVQQGTHCLDVLAQYAVSLRLSLVPVTGLKRDSAWQSAVRQLFNAQKQGVCIRLSQEDLHSTTLDQSVSNLISSLRIKHEEVDLLVDCEIINNSSLKISDLYSLIPDVDKWRNLILTGGAFPKDLNDYKKNERHSIKRLDWISWRDQVTTLSHDTRFPNFSDYTVQHAKYSTRRPGRMRYSANIRYTTEDSWIVMRGENVFREGGPGFNQYPDLAIMLCDLPQYCGEGYSSGDRYIKEISLQRKETGAAPQWLQAGINHHMAFVVHQLASL